MLVIYHRGGGKRAMRQVTAMQEKTFENDGFVHSCSCHGFTDTSMYYMIYLNVDSLFLCQLCFNMAF
jgi:hypothetical protein